MLGGLIFYCMKSTIKGGEEASVKNAHMNSNTQRSQISLLIFALQVWENASPTLVTPESLRRECSLTPESLRRECSLTTATLM
jgi:hypothetical protein